MPHPSPCTPRKDPVSLYGPWVGPRADLYGCRKYAPPPGFDPQTSQPIASRCNNRAILAHNTRNGHVVITAVALDCSILILMSNLSNTSTFSNKCITLLLLLPFGPWPIHAWDIIKIQGNNIKNCEKCSRSSRHITTVNKRKCNVQMYTWGKPAVRAFGVV
jgi:hypothetical protein